MEKWRKILVNVGLTIFLVWTSLLVILYLGFLWDKIAKPQYKNMNWEEAKYFGLVALVFTILDVLIARRFFKLLRKG